MGIRSGKARYYIRYSVAVQVPCGNPECGVLGPGCDGGVKPEARIQHQVNGIVARSNQIEPAVSVHVGDHIRGSSKRDAWCQ